MWAGGNLVEIWKQHPKKLCGADISAEMVNLAKKNAPHEIEIVKTNGTVLPYADKSFDVVMTATVLQHNTDEEMLNKLIGELCRVSRDSVVIFERIEDTIKGDELCLGRPISYYAQLFHTYGFQLDNSRFINVRVSYYVSGFIRKVFNRRDRKEGEPLTVFSIYLQRLTLPFTKFLDKIFTSDKDVARLVFHRK